MNKANDIVIHIHTTRKSSRENIELLHAAVYKLRIAIYIVLLGGFVECVWTRRIAMSACSGKHVMFDYLSSRDVDKR